MCQSRFTFLIVLRNEEIYLAGLGVVRARSRAFEVILREKEAVFSVVVSFFLRGFNEQDPAVEPGQMGIERPRGDE